MHYGSPLVDEMIAMLYSHPQLYVDTGGNNMFGSDAMVWPRAIEAAIESIETAEFLAPEQKRDILYKRRALPSPDGQEDARTFWKSEVEGGMRDMGRIVISCYRPKSGHQEALRELMRRHVATLRSIGLVTNRVPITMEAKDGTFVEVFEWVPAEAIEAAHSHPAVLRMWEEYGQVCDYIPISQVAEASQLFSEFTPFEVKA